MGTLLNLKLCDTPTLLTIAAGIITDALDKCCNKYLNGRLNWLIGDKLWNLIEYFDFEPRKVYSDRNLTYSPWCIWRQISYEKIKNKNHRFQNFIAFNIQAKWILCGTMTISYLELFLKYFWVGNYKQCKYQKSVRLPALNFCKYPRESSPSLFVCRFVCRRCPSLWQYEAVHSAVAIFGPCLLQCRPYRYWKEISNGFVYNDSLFFLFSILCF